MGSCSIKKENGWGGFFYQVVFSGLVYEINGFVANYKKRTGYNHDLLNPFGLAGNLIREAKHGAEFKKAKKPVG